MLRKADAPDAMAGPIRRTGFPAGVRKSRRRENRPKALRPPRLVRLIGVYPTRAPRLRSYVSGVMSDADRILQHIRESGYKVDAISGDGHWFMFATRDGVETSVRGGDLLRVAKALAVVLGLGEGAAEPAASASVSRDRPSWQFQMMTPGR